MATLWIDWANISLSLLFALAAGLSGAMAVYLAVAASATNHAGAAEWPRAPRYAITAPLAMLLILAWSAAHG